MTLQELLNLPGATLVGSRALGVATEQSDYDIVIPLSSIPKQLQERLDRGGDFSIARYFTRLPSMGRGWFFNHVYVTDCRHPIEVIVLENKDDLVSLQKAIESMQRLPKYMLRRKYVRIALFEDGLVHFGWTIPEEVEYNEMSYWGLIMDPIPQVKTIYDTFDDGKIRESRRYEVTITKLIPFPDATIDLLSRWNEKVTTCYWLYKPSTDYFVIGTIAELDSEIVYVRTKDNQWFDLDNLGGLLDTTGELAKTLKD